MYHFMCILLLFLLDLVCGHILTLRNYFSQAWGPYEVLETKTVWQHAKKAPISCTTFLVLDQIVLHLKCILNCIKYI